jgi:hypothetical protein
MGSPGLMNPYQSSADDFERYKNMQADAALAEHKKNIFMEQLRKLHEELNGTDHDKSHKPS